MIKRLPNIKTKLPALVAVVSLLLLWQLVCSLGLVPGYMLPSPVQVVQAFISEWPLLWENALITLQEAFIGLALGVLIGFGFAVLMDSWEASTPAALSVPP